MTRAERRHHLERLRYKRGRHAGRDLRHSRRELGKALASPCPCSCYLCGNTRHHHGPTLQEARAADTMAQQLAEANSHSAPLSRLP